MEKEDWVGWGGFLRVNWEKYFLRKMGNKERDIVAANSSDSRPIKIEQPFALSATLRHLNHLLIQDFLSSSRFS